MTAPALKPACPRLFEVEAYRIMALLALPIARRQSPRIEQIETALAALTDGLAQFARTASIGTSSGTERARFPLH